MQAPRAQSPPSQKTRQKHTLECYKHPTVTIIDTIPAGQHMYVEEAAWTGGKHQPPSKQSNPLIICAVTNAAGQQHLHQHSTPFLQAWNTAKSTTQVNVGTPTPIMTISLPNHQHATWQLSPN